MARDPLAQQTIPSAAPLHYEGRRMFGGRYTLLRRIGRGGMGQVWLAQDNELGVPRALKFAPTEVAADARSVALLKREAIAGTSLAHPNIVRIFDFVQDSKEQVSAVVMEAVEGKSLAELQAERLEATGDAYFEPEEIERWVREACAALDYAHGEGRVHRDLKPQNLMVETATGRLRILDFGISRRIGDSFSMLTGKDSSGTLPYMSPQQVMGDTVSASDDIYSLGATIYDLLTGTPPFMGGSLEAQVREKIPTALSQRRAEENATAGNPAPEQWQQMVASCLEKQRDARPGTAGAMLDCLQSAAGALQRGTRTPATKDAPFENSLGMKFVPVPIGAGETKGQWVLFSIWETRSRDYAAFVKDSGHDAGEDWKTSSYKGVPVGRGEGERAEESSHPVANVSHDDAVAFCAWLTKKDRASGLIGPGDEYRLPTDREWSYAVGIGDQEDASASPKDKSGQNTDIYPWGSTWPPPVGSGNYADSAYKAKFGSDWGTIDGYTDGYATTAPVGSFKANTLGLYDLGGNLWEWTSSPYEAGSAARVVRGGSWFDVGRDFLASSYRLYYSPDFRDCDRGFRCVVVVGRSSP
jgi:serine/threonine protein kinase